MPTSGFIFFCKTSIHQSLLPVKGLNLDSSDPESDVLPITPTGNGSRGRNRTYVVSAFKVRLPLPAEQLWNVLLLYQKMSCDRLESGFSHAQVAILTASPSGLQPGREDRVCFPCYTTHCDPRGTRTHNPRIKEDTQHWVVYQLRSPQLCRLS